MGKGSKVAEFGLLALLLNPMALLILLIAGIIFLAVAIGVIIYYGLVTAVAFFILGIVAVLVLHYVGAVNIERQPYIALMPFLLAVMGFVCERLQLLKVQALWTTGTGEAAQIPASLINAIIVILIVAAVAIYAFSSQKKR